ncbi:hypothetical protein C7121_29100 [Paenibacillus glucanolyticus]|jgi:hypothetical protein|uniref:stalk domain-containing protein n=1 Tax=Paenibacillus TaxID=44249 RepID=UPI0003E2369E|nr:MULTISPECIES: stalk domain-containing protein [Paenibacillus]ANA81376.1 hypothetical protein A3958_15950 [Paenibacillus glucanolyticus]AVV59893.1 hypothetical protein C7121_29100 [Paenibacillus glucanolyticus]ETT35612.1 hypothetical protein C169_16429 [Paenibacillus sp. FSL R5-808]OMF72200.1 hypothetical protein BK142_20830 [Paenibacillus glucanolyticus]
MKDKLKGLVIGITIGSMLTGVTAYAASGTSIKAVIQKVNLIVDGKKQTITKAITYNNTTYVPVRTLSNAVSKDISLRGDNLYVGKQPAIKVTQDKAASLVYSKIKKDADKYKLHFMEEGTEGSRYLIRAYENMTTHIATFGWYYVDMYSGVVYKWDLATDELIKL